MVENTKVELFRALEVKEMREDRELNGYSSDLYYWLSGYWYKS